MRTLKRVILATLCICMLTVGPSVFAASDDQTSADMVQQLVEEAEKMDPESTESVEKFAELLDTWEIGSEDSSDATSSLSGTMNSLQDLSGGNIQFIFAQLQQQLNQMCKDQAAKEIEQIQKQQEQQRQCTELLRQLRELNSTIKSTGTPVALSEDIKSRLIELGICSAGDAVMNKAVTSQEVDMLISYAENKLESIASSTQQEMVYIQDYIDQYNSYLQQSNAAIASAGGSQTSLAGGTMIGGSIGLLFTGILIGVFASVIVVLVVLRSRKKGA